MWQTYIEGQLSVLEPVDAYKAYSLYSERGSIPQLSSGSVVVGTEVSCAGDVKAQNLSASGHVYVNGSELKPSSPEIIQVTAQTELTAPGTYVFDSGTTTTNMMVNPANTGDVIWCIGNSDLTANCYIGSDGNGPVLSADSEFPQNFQHIFYGDFEVGPRHNFCLKFENCATTFEQGTTHRKILNTGYIRILPEM